MPSLNARARGLFLAQFNMPDFFVSHEMPYPLDTVNGSDLFGGEAMGGRSGENCETYIYIFLYLNIYSNKKKEKEPLKHTLKLATPLERDSDQLYCLKDRNQKIYSNKKLWERDTLRSVMLLAKWWDPVSAFMTSN